MSKYFIEGCSIMNKVEFRERFSYIIQIVLLCLFCWLFLNVLFVNQVYWNKDLFNPITVVLLAVCFLLTCVIAYRFILNHTKWFTKYEYVILYIVLLTLFLLQLYFGIRLQTNPEWDYEAVYRGAIQWFSKGNLGSFQDYFYRFPNNLGCLFLLKIYFQVLNIFGVKNFYLAGTVLVCIIFETGYYFVYLIVRRLYGIHNAMIALFLCVFILPIYFYGSIFYTDTLSFVFPALIYYLYLRVKDAKKITVKYLLFVIIGIVSAIGMLVKITVIFMLIAICIDIFLTLNIKQYFLKIGACFLVFATMILLFNIYIYNCGILDKSTADVKRIPYSHWLMMTLVNNGSYNNEDYGFIYSFSTTKEMDKAAWNRYFQRLDDYGTGRYILFLNRKQITTWGNGTYNINEFLRTRPVNKTFLDELVLDNGKYNVQFSNVCQGIHIALFVCIILYIFIIVKKHRDYKFTDNKLLAVYVVILGLYFFFLIWEANARYIINYIPIFIVAAVPSINEINKKIEEKKTKISS